MDVVVITFLIDEMNKNRSLIFAWEVIIWNSYFSMQMLKIYIQSRH